jgi:O-antigen/teichoic acid export membrane protein
VSSSQDNDSQEAVAQPVPGQAAGRRSVVYLAGVLGAGNYLSAALAAVGGVLQARYVGPPVLGLFSKIGLALDYSRFLHLGVLNGLNRELPYYVGKGEHQRVRELAAAAQAWALVLGAVVAAGLMAPAVWCLLCGNAEVAAGWATYAVGAFFLFYATMYLTMTYRTAHDFARLAVINVVQNAVALALVALVALLSFYGLCLRAVISGAIGTMMLHYWRPVRVGPKWNFAQWKHLLIVGLPIFGVGELYGLWGLLDRSLVAHYTGDVGMGLYTVVTRAVGPLELLPIAVSQVVYPRMAEQFGRTGRYDGLLGMAVKPMLLTAVAMAPAIAAGWWLVEPVTRILVPKYVDAVPAMRWSLLVPFVSSFGPINNIFNVVRQQGLYLAAILAGMGAYLVTLLWLIRGQAELIAFPQAMLAGRVVFMATCYALIAHLVRKQRNAARLSTS